MVKFSIISYYGAIESIKQAENAIREIDNTMELYNFPLFKYMYDEKEKVDNYLELLIDYIKDHNIQIVFWWFLGLPVNEFIHVKNITGVKYILYNWDEPYNWTLSQIKGKMSYLDAALVSCQETLPIYLENGCHHAECLYPGFDPQVHFPIPEFNFDYLNYVCDISICCTNLYEDMDKYPDQYIQRKKLIDDIYKNQSEYNYTFHIYGPESLASLYPYSYKGFVSYYDSNKVFNNSKINLCTHVLSHKEGYLNERVFLIGGAGGLLLVDYVKGIEDIFKINKEIIILDKYYYIDQIVDILSNYDKYIPCKDALYQKCINNYTYQHWARRVVNITKTMTLS